MRRSSRVIVNAQKVEREKLNSINMQNMDEAHLEIIDCGVKGRVVAASKSFETGDYVCIYRGELITQKSAFER